MRLTCVFFSYFFFIFLSFNISTLADTTTSTTNCWIINHYSSSASPASSPSFPLRPRLCMLHVFKWTQYIQRYENSVPRVETHRKSANRASMGKQALVRCTRTVDAISASDCTNVIYVRCKNYNTSRERCYPMTVIAPSLVRVIFRTSTLYRKFMVYKFDKECNTIRN